MQHSLLQNSFCCILILMFMLVASASNVWAGNSLALYHANYCANSENQVGLITSLNDSATFQSTSVFGIFGNVQSVSGFCVFFVPNVAASNSLAPSIGFQLSPINPVSTANSDDVTLYYYDHTQFNPLSPQSAVPLKEITNGSELPAHAIGGNFNAVIIAFFALTSAGPMNLTVTPHLEQIK